MKFTKLGKAFLTGVLSAGVIFGISSCVQSYTVGYLYVTGTVTAQPAGNGIVTGFRIDHNTGELAVINGLPVSSGGANPVRAVLTNGSRFLYVLNRGADATGDGNCYGTTSPTVCQSSNITQFLVGGNGILTPEEVFPTQGFNPFRMIVDSSGGYLLVLDHDAPSSAACQAALGAGVTSCGDVTIFSINSTTGRLSLIQNAQVSAAGTPLNYFPVPANPVDFVMAGSYLLTLSASNPATAYPYTGGTQVFPYAYNSTSGQLSLSQNTTQPLGIAAGEAIVYAGNNIYVLDNEPLTYTNFGASGPTTSLSQILPFTLGTNGALQAATGGIIPDAPGVSNPIYLIEESKNKYIYVANQGDNVIGNNAESRIAGYQIYSQPAFNLQFVDGEPWGSGSGAQCLVEDPSDQFVFTANEYDSSVTGRIVDPNSGVLNPMRTGDYTLQGPATWCLMDGRVN